MDILYKYSNLLPLSYFDTPTIKLSIPEHLNDPFEYSTSENIVISIKNALAVYQIEEEEIERLKEIFIDSIHRMISANGIISLTETPRNSLMWAHYAGQHKGMCIGYKNTLVEHIEPNNENTEDITNNKPLKVNYDNLRFSSEHVFANINDADRFSVIDHLLKKSDEWIYEKEHRCIIPYITANKILVTDKTLTKKVIKASDRKAINMSTATTAPEWIEVALHMGLISKTENDSIYTINENIEGVLLPVLRSTLQILSNFDCISFLIDINESMVDSVYFGCKVEKEKIKPYFEKLKDKITIYHMKVCNIRFELIPIKVNDDYFDKS
ncbi:DUF2971 domain-containing protein [Aeromonas sp. 1805]|uniref:DUF2971 domain-containing protein n=1 Tax=Aeromonas sp. 1805 TaxID=2560028 RepID=UPI00148AEDE7|nr:DUF2971 domain-containing protein [Aeromonas sp. 1805]QJT19098.1 DUF2971 domain-containing protein [Aeromonas sp. 1805]